MEVTIQPWVTKDSRTDGATYQWEWQKTVKLPENEKGDPEGSLRVYAEFEQRPDAYPGGIFSWVRLEATWTHREYRKKNEEEGHHIPLADFDEDTIRELAHAIREAGRWLTSVVEDEFGLDARKVEAEEVEWTIEMLNNATKRQHRYTIDKTPPGSKYHDIFKVYADVLIRSDGGLACCELHTIYQTRRVKQKMDHKHPILKWSDLEDEEKECILGALKGASKWAFEQLTGQSGA